MGCIEGCNHSTRTPFRCTYCGEIHCSEHRLPENHDCTALAHAKTLGPELRRYVLESDGVVLESETDRSVTETPTESAATEREGGDRETRVEPASSEDGKMKAVPKTACEDCGAEIASGRSQCPICNQLESEGIERDVCVDCSNVILSKKDRCVDCRRQHELIDSRSPDVSVTGEVVRDGAADATGKPERTEPSVAKRLFDQMRTTVRGTAMAVLPLARVAVLLGLIFGVAYIVWHL